MIKRIKRIHPLPNFMLHVEFDDGCTVLYNVGEDIEAISSYSPLKTCVGLFEQVQLDSSRTVIYWNDYIDLPSDTIYEYGQKVSS